MESAQEELDANISESKLLEEVHYSRSDTNTREFSTDHLFIIDKQAKQCKTAMKKKLDKSELTSVLDF
ncbi:hypothetical protein UY3_08515 [Chelonia mydas]|uniref:Uncharacterized protein n=1 Tax=Chelonia mydas TaxID=8469 RepID=M7B8T1_CHEMY|nr:hypothetical protein UY3_08515 [Chelonia mydas]